MIRRVLSWLLLLAVAAAAQKVEPPVREAIAKHGAGREHGRWLQALRVVESTPLARAQAEFVGLRAIRDLESRLPRRLEHIARSEGIVDSEAPLVRAAWPRLVGLFKEMGWHARRRGGDVKNLREARDAAGIVTAWMMAGPFDNERGGGFDNVYPPESSFDPDAVMDGKDRKVTWRALDFDVPDGRFALDALMQPARQAVAYLATSIQNTGDAMTALVWIGTSGGYKLFVNGAEAGAANVDRTFAFDQDVYEVPLQAGWNHLLLKVCAQDSPATTVVRVTGPDGRRAEALRVSNTPDDLATARRTRPAGTVRRHPDAEAWLDERVASGEAGLEATLNWAYLRLHRRTDNDELRATAAALEKAVVRFPKSADLWYELSRARNVRTRIRAERDDNRRLEALREALEIDPNHVPALLALGTHYATAFEVPTRAREYAERLVAAAPRFPDAHLLRAALRATMESGGRAKRELAKVETDPTVKIIRSRIQGHVRERRYGAALEAMKAFDGTLRDARLRRDLRTCHRGLGDDAAVEKLLREEIAIDPFAISAWRELAEYAEGRDDVVGALRTIGQALDIAPDDRGLLRKAAEYEQRLGHTDRARLHLARVLDLHPGDTSSRRYLERLDTDEVPFESAFPFEASTHVAAAPDWRDNPKNDSHRHLLYETIIKVNADGTARTFRRELIQVLSDAGARDLERLGVGGGPGTVTRVRKAIVHRRDGSTSDLDISGVGWRGGWVQCPKLEPGDVVHTEWRADEMFQSYFGNYFGTRHLFIPRDLSETLESRLRLILPTSRTFHLHELGTGLTKVTAPFDDDHEVTTWVVKDIERVDRETRMPESLEYSPQVHVSTYGTWDEFTGWWWNLIREQHTITDEMRAKVRELTAGVTDELEKVRRVYEWVCREIRYVAWEFGVHGYKPYAANTIFERRFGDCKDKAILINTMLKEVGVDTYPVLINRTRERPIEDLTLPLVGHFNHCIVMLPGKGDRPDLYLDGTAEFHPLECLPPGDRHADVVVVRDGKAQVSETDESKALDSTLTITGKLALDASGLAKGTIGATFGGLHGPGLRAQLETGGDRQRVLEEWLGRRFGRIEVERFTVSDPRDLSKDVTFEAALTADGIASATRDSMQVKLSPRPARLGTMVSKEFRTHDMVFEQPRAQKSRTELTLPAGWRVDGVPEPVDLTTKHGRYLMKVSVDGNEVVIEREFWITTDRITPGDYAEFRRFCQKVEATEVEVMTLRRGER